MFDSSVFKLPGAGRTAVLLAFLSLASALTAVIQAWAICTVLVGLWHGEDAGGMTGLLAIFAACFAGSRALEAIRDWVLKRFAAARAGELRRQALERLLAGRALDEDGSAGTGSAAGTALVIEGAEQVEAYLTLALGKAIDLAVIPVVLLVALFTLDPVSAVIALMAFPFIIFYMVMVGGNAHEVAAARQQEQARLSNHFLDALRGLDTLRLFGRARSHAASIFQVSESLRAATMRTLRTAMLSSAILDLFATLALAGVSVMLGFRLIDAEIGLYPALMALILVPEYFRPVRLFAADYHATLDGKQALAAMRALVDAPQRAQAPLDEGAWGERSQLVARDISVVYGEARSVAESPASSGGEFAAGGGDRSTAEAGAPSSDPSAVNGEFRSATEAPTPQDAGSAVRQGAAVVFEDAEADGSDAHRALDKVSFELRGFERVGVIGASGSGKSTLVSLLAGFLDPVAGDFELNWDASTCLMPVEVALSKAASGAQEGTGTAGAAPADPALAAPAPHGQQLPSLFAPAWQHQALYLPQRPYIFHASIAENIAFYAPGATREAIAEAAHAAGLDDLIASLPHGLDTVIGDGAGARELSGGEAQRVALARAWVDRSRRILLFDEPTAHLDIETELELKDRMLPLMEGRLVVFATHRLHWLYEMDRVFVLSNGRLAAAGDPRELLAQGVIKRSLGLLDQPEAAAAGGMR